jgi:feruloyl esterase
MVPGMNHCGGGPGPNTFDTLTALEKWVEQSVAPDTLLATHTNGGGVIDRTMPLCKFPEMATYRGLGDLNDAASWRCGPGAALLGVAASK